MPSRARKSQLDSHARSVWQPGDPHQVFIKDCKPCQLKAHCTTAPRRALSIRVKEHHQALQEVRTRQKGTEFWEKYRSRSGIEGTISQGVRAFGLRRSRYRGMQKTHLQHLVSAAVINLVRTLAWLDEKPLAKTRTSKFAALALVA